MGPEMSSIQKRDAHLREYLLGELPPKSQQELEEQMMTDDRVFEELLLTEEELIDSYVKDGLSEHESERFENHFLSTAERQTKLSFAAALRDYVESAPDPKIAEIAEKRQDPVRSPFMEWFSVLVGAPSTALGVSMAAALLLVVLGGSWLIVGNWRLQSRLVQVTEDRSSLETLEQDLQKQLAEERSRRGETETARGTQPRGASTPRPVGVPSVASFLLAPVSLRGPGGDMARVILTSETSLVRLELDLGLDDHESYQATLHTVDGDEIWYQKRLEAETSNDRVVVSLILPATLLRHDDYYFRLIGVSSDREEEPIDRYTFRVIVE